MEYPLSSGGTVEIKSYEEWLYARCRMTEEEFRTRLDARPARFVKYGFEQTDAVIGRYRSFYSRYVDRIHLGHIPLTFLEYLESYEGHTPSSFHAMCAAAGMARNQEDDWMECIKKAWEEHENNLIPF